MSDKLIKFEVVTPERVVIKEMIRQVTVPTKSGEITILPNHIPLVSNIDYGVIEVLQENGDREVISTSGGFVEVLKNKVVILADTAERAAEIDVKRSEEARQRAEELKLRVRHVDDMQFAEANIRIAKEIARSRAIKRWKKLKNIETIQ